MFFSCEPRLFSAGDTDVADLDIHITQPVVLNRLFILCMAAVDFYICGAVLKRKFPTDAEPVVLQPEGKTHATLFAETSFGISPSGYQANPGDVIGLSVCRFGEPSTPRWFSASWEGGKV